MSEFKSSKLMSDQMTLTDDVRRMAFRINRKYLQIEGYGMDGPANAYLKSTLQEIKGIIPIHADGDGNCMVHAVSRALVGWQVFWHPLMVAMGAHLTINLPQYKVK